MLGCFLECWSVRLFFPPRRFGWLVRVMHFWLKVFCSLRNGCTALVVAVRFLAAANGRVHVVEELIAAGSDVDAKNDNG